MGKKYLESLKLVDKNTQYTTTEAMELIVKTSKAKFDETVEVALKLGVDPRHADQQVRGAVVLPLSLIHISEPTRLLSISYAVFCLKKKKKKYRLNDAPYLH